MPAVVVGGSARHVGKTSLICSLIAGFPRCPWTAIKITRHEHGKPAPVWEETEPGQGTDTARYLAAGARRALLVTGLDGTISTAQLQIAIAEDRWLIFETNQIPFLDKADLVLAVAGSLETQSKPSFAEVLRRADAIVYTGSGLGPSLPDSAQPVFVQPDPRHLPLELIDWMRKRLGLP